MPSLLAPFMLAALAALAVPLVIHLWSRGEARRVPVGSIRLLEQTETRQARRLRLTQVPLLLVRMGLLAVLALLLARPVWTAAPEAAPTPQTQVLVAPEALRDPNAETLQTIDSLRRAGAEVRLLAAGLPALSAADAEARLETPPPDTTVPDVWSLLREVDAARPAASEIVVIAPSRRALFRGERPALRSGVRWLETGPRGVNRWIAAARRVPGDSVAAAVGASTPQATRWSEAVLPPSGAAGGRPLRLRGDTLRLTQTDALPTGDAQAVMPAADTLRLSILHHADRLTDAQYVRAAFRIAARYARRPIRIEQAAAGDEPRNQEAADQLFWLHPDAAPDSIRRRVAEGGTLVEDAAGDSSTAVASVILMPGSETPDLHRRTPSSTDGRAAWTDGFGRPLLTEARAEGRRHLRFHSRFHPSWNGLVLSAAFPEWTLGQMQSPPTLDPVQDLRRISARQRSAVRETTRPVALSEEAEPITARGHTPLWLLTVLLFAAERWMAFRSET